MGMFDEVRFRCPKCTTVFTEQTKAGDCILESYDSSEVPIEIARALHGEDTECSSCKSVFTMVPMSNPTCVPMGLVMR